MDALPAELVEHVLASSPEILGPRDIINVGACSKRLWDAVRRSQRIWKGQFRRRFPSLYRDPDTGGADWRERYATRLLCERRCAAAVGNFSAAFWHCEDIGNSDIEPKMAGLVGEFDPEVLLDSLRQLNRAWAPEHLTLRYYGLRALEWLQKTRLTVEMRALLEKRGGDGAEDEETVIRALAIAAQWFQPEKTVDYEAIKRWLDAAAKRTLRRLAENKVFGAGRLAEKRWATRIEACQVMDAVSHVMFSELGLKGNTDNYYDMRNSFIDEVIERGLGIPIMLSLLFMSVAARVGLTLRPSNLPGHFMLRLEVGDEGEGAAAKDFLYVDAFNGGKAMSCFEVMALVKRLAGDDINITDDCAMLVPTPRQVYCLLRGFMAYYLVKYLVNSM